MRSMLSAFVLAFCLTGGTSAGIGCSDCSVSGQTPVLYEGGTTNASKTVYQTMAPQEEMLHFPQGRTYDFYHGLGSVPVSVEIYLSFKSRLEDPEDVQGDDQKLSPNNVAPSAGSQAVIEVWNKDYIRVRNDTCAEFHLRVVAIADPDAVAGAEGAGAGGMGMGGADGVLP